jgi:hypothetical protein
MNGATYVPDSFEGSDAVVSDHSEFGTTSSVGRRRATRTGAKQAQRSEFGVPGWAAVLVLLAISGVGGLIDESNGTSVRGWFNWSLVLGSLVAILIVRRTQMFGVVIAPPLIYFIASAGMLYIRSDGLKNRDVLINAAANWLVYGFPAIAGASAVVLAIAGIRMITRR